MRRFELYPIDVDYELMQLFSKRTYGGAGERSPIFVNNRCVYIYTYILNLYDIVSSEFRLRSITLFWMLLVVHYWGDGFYFREGGAVTRHQSLDVPGAPP